jgi:hypothetical protein
VCSSDLNTQRWNGFYQWMYHHGLLEKDIAVSGAPGFTNEYLP